MRGVVVRGCVGRTELYFVDIKVPVSSPSYVIAVRTARGLINQNVENLHIVTADDDSVIRGSLYRYPPNLVNVRRESSWEGTWTGSASPKTIHRRIPEDDLNSSCNLITDVAIKKGHHN